MGFGRSLGGGYLMILFKELPAYIFEMARPGKPVSRNVEDMDRPPMNLAYVCLALPSFFLLGLAFWMLTRAISNHPLQGYPYPAPVVLSVLGESEIALEKSFRRSFASPCFQYVCK